MATTYNQMNPLIIAVLIGCGAAFSIEHWVYKRDAVTAVSTRIDAATLAKIETICAALPTAAQSACLAIKDAINSQESAQDRHKLIKQAVQSVRDPAALVALEDAQMKIIGLVPEGN
ncbi:unnamed protein product, partial [Mesorhabditis spiculigera]